MVMTRSQFRKQLQEGLNTVFGMAYMDYPEEWSDIFMTEGSTKAFEEDVLNVGLGGAQLKGEGAPVYYDEGGEAWTARYNHDTIGIAFAITEEALEDNLYGDIGAKYARSMARSLKFTKEVKGAEIINNGFSTASVPFETGDGVSLFNTAHPLWSGGTFSNTLSTASDLSEAALEDACNQIANFVDDRGIPIKPKVKRLVVPQNSNFEAFRILNSTLRVDTANNDPNALRDMGLVPTMSLNHYFSDDDFWLLVTDIPDGAKHFRRRPVKRGIEGDFETGNMRYKATERYSFGATDPRSLFGVPGSGS